MLSATKIKESIRSILEDPEEKRKKNCCGVPHQNTRKKQQVYRTAFEENLPVTNSRKSGEGPRLDRGLFSHENNRKKEEENGGGRNDWGQHKLLKRKIIGRKKERTLLAHPKKVRRKQVAGT